MNEHEPVLYQEILFYLRPVPGGKYIDGTIGGAGHSAGLLEGSEPDGKVLGLDRDAEAIAFSRKRLAGVGERAILVQASYSDMGQIARERDFTQADGILLDLGLSSRQLAAAERGFSFQSEGPLDMRFDRTSEITAADLVNELDETALAELLWRYGEVPQSRRVARAIVAARPLYTTTALASVASEFNAWRRGTRRIHPATRVFQALRIAVNEELKALESVLPDAVDLLREGGRLAVISFHSLEDRLVKQFIRDQSRDCVCPPEAPFCTCAAQPTLKKVTNKVVRPTDEEVAVNPRSRSARLRVAEKIGESAQ